MITNEKLCAAIRESLERNSNVTVERADRIIRDVEAYEKACSLSRGPVADRAEVWEHRARERLPILLSHYRYVAGKDWVTKEVVKR